MSLREVQAGDKDVASVAVWDAQAGDTQASCCSGQRCGPQPMVTCSPDYRVLGTQPGVRSPGGPAPRVLGASPEHPVLGAQPASPLPPWSGPLFTRCRCRSLAERMEMKMVPRPAKDTSSG